MNTLISRLVVFAAAISFAAHAAQGQPATAPSALDAALAELGLSIDDIRIARGDLDRLTNRASPCSVLAHLFDEPLQTKWYMQHFRGEILKNLMVDQDVALSSAFWQGVPGAPASAKWRGTPLGLAETIGHLSRWGDRVVRRTLLGNPVMGDLDAGAKPEALIDAIAALHQRAGHDLSAAHREKLAALIPKTPPPAARAAALVLRVVDRAIEARDRAVRHLRRFEQGSGSSGPRLWSPDNIYEVLSQSEEGNPPEFRDRVAAFELGHLMAAAQELSAAVHLAAQMLSMAPAGGFSFSWETPYGRVLVGGEGHTIYEDDKHYLLIIDTSGDDEYHAGGGAAGLKYPVSIVIDVRGDDRYAVRREAMIAGAATQPVARAGATQPATQPAVPPQRVACAFGAGMLGIGMLVDAQGKDSYDAARMSQGAALFGVGLLDDWSGDDTYFGVSECQGSATAGLGLLVDRGGDDTYHAFTGSQAYAGVAGIAALVDLGGDDKYIADDEDIRFPSAQSAIHNNSMCQGAASGQRADYIDGYGSPGGFALLLDSAGDDQYSCGVFGQGAGYWLGAGVLVDSSGNDSYMGQWYVQGAAAHFALAGLLDEAGDDRYEARMATSQGTGHDLSLGFMADLAGNDHYYGAGLTTGAGNESGIGIVIDAGGNDAYEIGADVTLGYANAPDGVRATIPTFGLFLDAGGRDTYSQAYAGDGKRWGIGKRRGFERLEVPRRAIGLDAELGSQQLDAVWRRRR